MDSTCSSNHWEKNPFRLQMMLYQNGVPSICRHKTLSIYISLHILSYYSSFLIDSFVYVSCIVLPPALLLAYFHTTTATIPCHGDTHLVALLCSFKPTKFYKQFKSEAKKWGKGASILHTWQNRGGFSQKVPVIKRDITPLIISS